MRTLSKIETQVASTIKEGAYIVLENFHDLCERSKNISNVLNKIKILLLQRGR